MTSNFLEIDGSFGEGGGQILRSALALSLVTRQPVRIERIRAGRRKPGLMRQHLTAVRAAAAVGAAEVVGDAIGSQSLSFTPRALRPGDHHFAVGTAGSATLVLQTVLPALVLADGPSELIVEGGTHNPWSPPFEFLARAFFPLLNRLGPTVSATLERHGFYPAGGGRIAVRIEPAAHLTGLQLLERGELVNRACAATVAKLSPKIAERELAAAKQKLNWPGDCFYVREVEDSLGPGNIVTIAIQSEYVGELFTGFGRVDASAEKVAGEAVKQARDYLASGAPVGRFLADQLLLLLGVAALQFEASSCFRTLPLSRHSATQIEVLRQFGCTEIEIEEEQSTQLVRIGR